MIYSKSLREDIVFKLADIFAVSGLMMTPAAIVAGFTPAQSVTHDFATRWALFTAAYNATRAAITLAEHWWRNR